MWENKKLNWKWLVILTLKGSKPARLTKKQPYFQQDKGPHVRNYSHY